MSPESEAASRPRQLLDANSFRITGPIAITYDSTSFLGVPRFSYKDAELDLDFSGDEITRADSPLGQLVTVTLQDAVDAFIRTFTLVVPTVRVQQQGEEVSFDTFGVETVDRSFAFTLPPGPLGALQSYRSHQLQGTAQNVSF